MAHIFDRERMLTNISALIQQRGIKIGELENRVGVSAGYLSRLCREDSKTIPAVDVVWKIAKELEVNMEVLLEGTCDYLSPNMVYMQKFLNRLLVLTLSDSIEWESYSVSRMEQALRQEQPLDLPFIETDKSRTFTDDRPDLLDVGYHDASISACGHSRFIAFSLPGTSHSLAGSCFSCEMDSWNTLYLVKYVDVMYDTADETDSGVPSAVEWYELFIWDASDGHAEVVCNTLAGRVRLLADVEMLYMVLKEKEQDLRITPTVRSIIDSFMHQYTDEPDEPEAVHTPPAFPPAGSSHITVDESDLPF